MSAESIRWRDRVTVARHELLAAGIVIADVLARREVTTEEWDRLSLAYRRLTALTEDRT